MTENITYPHTQVVNIWQNCNSRKTRMAPSKHSSHKLREILVMYTKSAKMCEFVFNIHPNSAQLFNLSS